MRTIILIIASLLIVGCKQGDNMATIGEEVNGELVSTNVTDSTQVYDDTLWYPEGDEVLDGDSIYEIVGPPPILHDASYVPVKGDVVEDAVGDYYDVIKTYEDVPPDSTNTLAYASISAYKVDIENFDAATNYCYPVGPSDTVCFTFVSGETWDKTTSGPYGGTVQVTIFETWREGMTDQQYFFHNGHLYRRLVNYTWLGNTRYYYKNASITPTQTLNYLRMKNQLRPLDGANITPAIHDGSVSDMQYVFKGLEEFNAFTLAKVLADSITYSFTLPVGHVDYALWLDGVVVASGGNGIVKTDTVAIDCTRDSGGILSNYPTTVIYYADMQMPIDSTVTISLAYGFNIQLGDFTLDNAVSDGLTNLSFGHAIQDYNEYAPDAWGNIPEGVKAVVTKFNITMDVDIDDYDRMVSLHESLVRNFVTVDGSDSGTAVAGSQVFNSLTRRVLITNVSSKTAAKDGSLDDKGVITLAAREIV